MNYTEIFPQILGNKVLDYIPDGYIAALKDFILNKIQLSPLHQKTDAVDYTSVSERIFDNEIFNNLEIEILNYARKYTKYLGISFEDLQIASSWAYITNPNNLKDNFHRHGNSLISGVFYLTEGGGIEFRSSFYDDLFFKTNFQNEEEFNKHHYQFKIQEKQLILFPSNMWHAVMANTIKDRVSIPFNIIPKGKFGFNHAKLFL